MTKELKTRLIAAGAAATLLTGLATFATPPAGEILGGAAILAALVGMGSIEMKKRAY